MFSAALEDIGDVSIIHHWQYEIPERFDGLFLVDCCFGSWDEWRLQMRKSSIHITRPSVLYARHKEISNADIDNRYQRALAGPQLPPGNPSTALSAVH